ncbi:MAG: HAD-IA family hydrolase [Candidatus Micrarchaeota archaeon]|nr:HAD-IA family hydrolase [Candidatus Micrarchaeota archaeon]MDE1847393.1 HAD-IA family hydrolase [Candidatus Micrarchaeota archaeon]MDE1864008.1 HAD-IA family hydrolase [Candidatus Micrarchaeota archaeon]
MKANTRMIENVSLIIFDVGGVFRDSSKALNEGYRRAFAKYEFEYPFSAQTIWHLRGIGRYNERDMAIRALLSFLRSGDSLDRVLEGIGAEKELDLALSSNIRKEDEAMISAMTDEYKKFFHSESAKDMVDIYAGVGEGIETLYRSGYKLALFTNSSRVTVARDLKFLDMTMFGMVLSEEDVTRKKPSGEGIMKIMEGMGASPEETAYVGDTIIDIMAAKDANCVSISLLCGMGIRKHLEAQKPDFIFKDLYDAATFIAKSRTLP